MRTGCYKRKDGRWEAYVIYNDPDTGKEKKKSFYGKAKYGQDAKRKMNEFIMKIEAGDYSDVSKVTVEGWLNKFLEVYCAHLAETTKEGYGNYIFNHIVPVLGKLKLSDIKPLHIQRFYNDEREKNFSETTILQEHRILHKAFKKAVGDGLISKNPCDGVDAPSPEDFNPNVYTEEQFALLLNKLKGQRMEAIVLIAGMCGLRRGELLGLTWQDVDLDNGIIRIKRNVVPTSKGNITKKPKTKKSMREFSIPSSIIPRLKQLRGIGKIFTRLDGKEYNPGSVSRMFKEFLEKNGLPHIRLHDLRHFNCTMMLKYGVSDKEAQERSGHSNPNMLRKYQHILDDMDKDSADKLNNVLKVVKPSAVNLTVK